MTDLNVITHSWESSEQAEEFDREDMPVNGDRLDAAYSAWNEITNMSDMEMEMWDMDACANTSAGGAESVRDNTQMLLGSPKESWGLENVVIAERQVDFLQSMAEMLEEDMPDDAASGGEGTCPRVEVVKMLNRGHNPLETMPAGDPEPTKATTEFADIEQEVLDADFSSDDGELDEVYGKWSDAVNMSASQLERWSEHDCADTASRDPEAVRKRNMGLLEKDKSDWTDSDIDDAKRTVSFISRMRGQKPDSPAEGGKGTCPSEWAVSLLNWAYNSFDGMPEGTPDPEQENADGERGLVYDDSGDALELSFGATTLHEPISDGFNEYGIKKNFKDGELVSVDAVYEAMEPGPPKDRNGVRITEDFLKKVAEKDYSDRPPHLMDHRYDTLSHIGFVQDVWFNAERSKLMVQARTYNTGADTHDEIVKRLTHEPPAISDGSLGFGQSYEAAENDDGERELVDGKIQEFSTTPFPGGYDEGGLRVAGKAD